MKIKNLLVVIAFLALNACCHNPYVLNINSEDGKELKFTGTVLSVEKDGDFLMEVKGKYLFVDMGDLPKQKVELGDYIEVHGSIDIDEEGNEQPELDAIKINKAELRQ